MAPAPEACNWLNARELNAKELNAKDNAANFNANNIHYQPLFLWVICQVTNNFQPGNGIKQADNRYAGNNEPVRQVVISRLI